MGGIASHIVDDIVNIDLTIRQILAVKVGAEALGAAIEPHELKEAVKVGIGAGRDGTHLGSTIDTNDVIIAETRITVLGIGQGRGKGRVAPDTGSLVVGFKLHRAGIQGSQASSGTFYAADCPCFDEVDFDAVHAGHHTRVKIVAFQEGVVIQRVVVDADLAIAQVEAIRRAGAV